MNLYSACLPHLQGRWEIAERMEGAGSGRRGDAVKDARVKGRWEKEKKQEGKTEEQREEREEVIDLSCFTDSFPSTSFVLGHLT